MGEKFKIYLGKSITGRTPQEVFSYYEKMKKELSEIGLMVLHPLVGKGDFKNDSVFTAGDYKNKSPVSSNHAIKNRDQFMVKYCDIVLINLLDTTKVSIGCVAELAWANLLGKHTILCMERGNIHEHAFVFECADIIFETLAEAKEYLQTFVNQSFE